MTKAVPSPRLSPLQKRVLTWRTEGPHVEDSAAGSPVSADTGDGGTPMSPAIESTHTVRAIRDLLGPNGLVRRLVVIMVRSFCPLKD